MLVAALPGSGALAQALADELQCATTELVVHRFPDGEALVRIDAPVRGECVVLAASLHQPDAKTLPLLFAADAARELGAARVGLVAPYLAYMRQDARFHPGEAITSRSYAKLLSEALDFLVTVDPHLHRWNSLTDIYSIPSTVVPSAAPIALWLRAQVRDALLVGPDSESAQWVSEVARLARVPWTTMAKTRRGDRDVRVVLQPDPAWRGRSAVLLDDIVSTGHTIAAAAQALAEAGFAAPWCVAVHALFEDGAIERLKAAGVARIVSCDTVPHPTNAIPLGPLLAQATQALADR